MNDLGLNSERLAARRLSQSDRNFSTVICSKCVDITVTLSKYLSNFLCMPMFNSGSPLRPGSPIPRNNGSNLSCFDGVFVECMSTIIFLGHFGIEFNRTSRDVSSTVNVH